MLQGYGFALFKSRNVPIFLIHFVSGNPKAFKFAQHAILGRYVYDG